MTRFWSALGLCGCLTLLTGSLGALTPWSVPTLVPVAGSADIHPGAPLFFSFLAPVRGALSSTLVDGAHQPVPVHRQRSPDERSLIVQPDAPLRWETAYRFCSVQDRAAIFQWLLGPRQTCSDFRTMAKPGATGPNDAPILIVEGADRPFSRYNAEILKAEGLNAFATIPAEDMAEGTFDNRAVVILDTASLLPALVADADRWVRAGGLLIAMRPGQELRREFGLPGVQGDPLDRTLLRPDTSSPITQGFAPAPLPLHGPVDRFVVPDLGQTLAHVLARIEEGAGEHPAITLSDVGLGHVSTFAFSLAQSVVLTRQGNPLWVDEERDGSYPVRPNDLFYPDFVDLAHAGVPVADELQRLFANIIVEEAGMPMPRFWYLPDNRRAVILMSGDDHASRGGTRTLFEALDAASPPACRLDRWECLRATAYLSPGTIFSAENAESFAAKGFELGVHVDTGCSNPKGRPALTAVIHSQIEAFRASYPRVPPQQTHRMHCIVWSGWVDVPVVTRQMGVRLDLNYYNWPPAWIAGRPGYMTGSGLPMPYADLNGESIGVYQAATHLVNEDGVEQRYGIEVMLDRALGPEQYFSAFGTHYDYTDDYAWNLFELGRSRGVALITVQQMLTWLDGRNASHFSDVTWRDQALAFTMAVAPGAEAASTMLPSQFGLLTLATVTCGGQDLPLTYQTIKGLELAFMPATPGRCIAQYGEAMIEAVKNGG